MENPDPRHSSNGLHYSWPTFAFGCDPAKLSALSRVIHERSRNCSGLCDYVGTDLPPFLPSAFTRLPTILILLTVAAYASPTVTVISPKSGTAAGAPVFYEAYATSPECSAGISEMRIYTAPGVNAFTIGGATLNIFSIWLRGVARDASAFPPNQASLRYVLNLLAVFGFLAVVLVSKIDAKLRF